ncbi:hypothetical protein QVD17_32594 [Tagetes erecta]|uniref:Uncharacterized protein n=1 Tax=Tagetes erecta TaxID=13708 RepID=A0AAD8JVP1_TARER|nr:hypothetical protein QVD17_32594 [Tagetes erecta]
MEGPPDVDSVRPIFRSDSSSDPSEQNEKSDKNTKNLNGPQQHEPPTPIKPPEPQPPGVVLGGNRGLIMREKTSRKRTAYILEIRCTKSKKIQTDDGSSDTQVDIEVTDLGRKKQVNEFDHNEQAKTIFNETVSSGSSPHSCNDTLTQHEFKTRMEQVNAELKTLRDEMDKRELKILHMFESFRESVKAESVPKVIEYKYLRPIKGKGKKMK